MAPSLSRAPRLALFAAAGLLIVAGAVGCGGDRRRAENESTETANRASAAPAGVRPGAAPAPVAKVTDPARRSYVSRVDAVCGRLDPERAGSQEKVGAAAGPREAARAYDDTIAIGARELHEIEAIPPPPGERALLRANVFDVIGRELAIRRQMATALAAVDVPRLRRLRGELDSLSRSLGGFARGYGFRVCGEA